MTDGEWIIAGATLLGPVLAVQAQKLIERLRERKMMKEKIFFSLMATRQDRLARDHVQSLNMINIAFYGRKMLWFHWQSATEKAVCRAWREYFDNLSIDTTGYTQDNLAHLFEQRMDKFIALLGSIAVAQNYDFEPLDLKKNGYSPTAHNQMGLDNDAIRSGLVKALNGGALKMEITNFPTQSQP